MTTQQTALLANITEQSAQQANRTPTAEMVKGQYHSLPQDAYASYDLEGEFNEPNFMQQAYMQQHQKSQYNYGMPGYDHGMADPSMFGGVTPASYLHQQMQALPPHLQAQILQTAHAHLQQVMQARRYAPDPAAVEAQRFAQWQQQRQQQQQYLFQQHDAQQQQLRPSASRGAQRTGNRSSTQRHMAEEARALPLQEVEPSERRRPTGLTPVKEAQRSDDGEGIIHDQHEELCNCPDCNSKRLQEALRESQQPMMDLPHQSKYRQLDPHAFEFQPAMHHSASEVALAAAYAGMSPLGAPSMGFDQAMQHDEHSSPMLAPSVVVGTRHHNHHEDYPPTHPNSISPDHNSSSPTDALTKFRAMNAIGTNASPSISSVRRQNSDLLAAFGSKKTSPVIDTNTSFPAPQEEDKKENQTPTKQSARRETRPTKKDFSTPDARATHQTTSVNRNSSRKDLSSAQRRTPNREITRDIPSKKMNNDGPAFHVELHVVRGRKVKAVAQFELQEGDHVIFEGDRGFDLGQAMNLIPIEAGKLDSVLSQSPNPPYRGTPLVMRLARSDEIERWQQMIAEAREAVPEAQNHVDTLHLPIRVVDAVYQYDREKLTFFYDAASRVDFRQLLKELFGVFRCRIWMEPIEGSGASHNTNGKQ